MHLRFQVCIFPLPIVHPSEQVEDQRSFIIKACPLCHEWFHANDIVVASCGYTYHPFFFFFHLYNSTCCVVEFFHEPMHLD